MRDLGLREWSVHFEAIPGARIADIWRRLPVILAARPDAVLLQIGGNDVTGETAPDYVHIAAHLTELARALRRGGVRRVFVGKLLFRAWNARFLPSERKVETYNAKVAHINLILDQLARRLHQEGIVVWNHKGREECASAWLASDGTHLNARGAAKYWWSWRRALISTHTLWNGRCARAQRNPIG